MPYPIMDAHDAPRDNPQKLGLRASTATMARSEGAPAARSASLRGAPLALLNRTVAGGACVVGKGRAPGSIARGQAPLIPAGGVSARPQECRPAAHFMPFPARNGLGGTGDWVAAARCGSRSRYRRGAG